jgi:competence protein ComFC
LLTMLGKIISPINWLIEAVFPRFCVSCQSEGEILCRSCLINWQSSPSVKKQTFTSFNYADFIARELVQAWKYDFDISARNQLFQQIALQDQALIAFCESRNIKKITWIPLHYQRRNERGFDQAEIVAKYISQITKIPCEQLLSRSQSTVQQARLANKERRKILKKNPFKSRKTLNGEVILLVDDVITSGSTMKICEKNLLASGAGSIRRYAILRAK